MDLGAFASRVSGVTEGRVHKGDAPPSQQGDDECAMYDDSPGGCWVREPPYHPGRQIDYDKQRDAKEAARKAAAQAGLYFCMRQRVHPRFAGWA